MLRKRRAAQLEPSMRPHTKCACKAPAGQYLSFQPKYCILSGWRLELTGDMRGMPTYHSRPGRSFKQIPCQYCPRIKPENALLLRVCAFMRCGDASAVLAMHAIKERLRLWRLI